MHKEGKLETEAILVFQSIRFSLTGTTYHFRTIEMRRAENPEAELILTFQPRLIYRNLICDHIATLAASPRMNDDE
ncbi:hypothetical protein M378DRAFT_10847 [Amanita muscaria Koide BX008]|uniref:Uncharacterized protein n=1 Tax=Amanita muscaria (strain Koide BX008) TaxID=946122 RepID=A0A0C2X857_AMAMK|nr:hypothetical protein M378DRAFT_10847 [Amanita muscaria Koide BX008]